MYFILISLEDLVYRGHEQDQTTYCQKNTFIFRDSPDCVYLMISLVPGGRK